MHYNQRLIIWSVVDILTVKRPHVDRYSSLNTPPPPPHSPTWPAMADKQELKWQQKLGVHFNANVSPLRSMHAWVTHRDGISSIKGNVHFKSSIALLEIHTYRNNTNSLSMISVHWKHGTNCYVYSTTDTNHLTYWD